MAITMVHISADTSLAIFPVGTTLATAKVTHTHCKPEMNDSSKQNALFHDKDDIIENCQNKK